MSKQFGVNLPDRLVDRIEGPLEYGDSRSARIRELIELGLVVENDIRRMTSLLYDPKQVREQTRQLLIDHLSETDDIN